VTGVKWLGAITPIGGVLLIVGWGLLARAGLEGGAMPTLKDQAVVLRLVDWSETSQIAVLLTREHGKISAVAKGAKRQTPSIASRFSGGLELLCRGEAVYITKSGRDLGEPD
jgi:hypothetical protein